VDQQPEVLQSRAVRLIITPGHHATMEAERRWRTREGEERELSCIVCVAKSHTSRPREK